MSDALLDHAGLSEDQLAEILALVAGTDVIELRVRIGEHHQLRLRRAASPTPSPTDQPPQAGDGASAEEGSLAISSPLVGIFHANVRPGDVVQHGQSIGAIEALGMPTSVDAPQSGTVEDMLVTDGTAVEYGQPLLVLRRGSS